MRVPRHTCGVAPRNSSLVTGEPQPGGQRRRLTEAIPQNSCQRRQPARSEVIPPG